MEIDDETYTHRTECFGCLHDFIHENYGEVMPSAISVLDYATFGTKSEKMIDGFEAHYLFGTSRLKGSMPPFVAAFASEKAAREHQEELGGELADFNAMRKMMMKAKGEDEPSGHEGHGGEGMADALYVCPCSGDCCSDISSKDPGECPNCGMELVQKS
ncbi:MAG TPA: hypothetical protein ENO21_05045 [Firmicutes bacterium]|nr:hypothetical protein [Bacillota bacterium]